MVGSVYSVAYHNIAVDSAHDLLELTAPADTVLQILRTSVGQRSDSGDAESEILRINIVRYATGGTGGVSETPSPHNVGQAASGVVADRNNTTIGGTPTIIHSSDWNVQVMWSHDMVPEEVIWVPPGGIIAINLPAAPAEAISTSVSITWRELGG